jgi:hypothetical protein
MSALRFYSSLASKILENNSNNSNNNNYSYRLSGNNSNSNKRDQQISDERQTESGQIDQEDEKLTDDNANIGYLRDDFNESDRFTS